MSAQSRLLLHGVYSAHMGQELAACVLVGQEARLLRHCMPLQVVQETAAGTARTGLSSCRLGACLATVVANWPS
jgi:hypothetical protein